MSTRKHGPAKLEKIRKHGAKPTVASERTSRRPELDLEGGGRPQASGDRSDRAMASRTGRQPVLQAQGDHPAQRGPRMSGLEVAREDAAGAAMKPGAATD